jgi:hypothetical protein
LVSTPSRAPASTATSAATSIVARPTSSRSKSAPMTSAEAANAAVVPNSPWAKFSTRVEV